MGLEGSIGGLRYRRSRRSDAALLARMMDLGDALGDGLPTPNVFRVSSEGDFAALIETALVSVTAVRDVPADASSAAAAASLSPSTAAVREVVVGFVCLDDAPPIRSPAQNSVDGAGHAESAKAWAAALAGTADVSGATLANSLWLRMLLAPDSSYGNAEAKKAIGPTTALRYSTAALVVDLLRVTLGSVSTAQHIFMALSAAFPCVAAMAGVTELSKAAAAVSLRHLPRSCVLSPLTMRQGRVEDYDDAVALLVAGGPGIITELPADFYLEELLQSQDGQHKVLVAEDSATHEVVGLACVRQMGLEEQQYLARYYNTDTLERLKPLNVDGSDAAQGRQYQDGRTPSGTASIFFLYFNPRFEHSAHQLLPYVFHEFPTCDYATVQRTHAQTPPEPMVLERFQYMPLRRYQPHNARGEVCPPPDALWVCPRVALEAEIGMEAQVTALTGDAHGELRAAVLSQFGTPRAASAAGSGVHAVLHHQQHSRGGSASSGGPAPVSGFPGCSAELVSALREDLGAADFGETPTQDGTSGSGSGGAAAPRSCGVFALTWGLPVGASGALGNRSVVGVLSVQALSVGEMYALRANYNVDGFVGFNSAGGFDYSATDITLSAREGPLRYRSAEMPGLAVRFVYVRPAFRHHLKFFLREVLRQTMAEVLVNLTSVDTALCQTALSAFTFVPPRRVVETGTAGAGGDGAGAAAGAGAQLEGSLAGSIPEVNDVTPALARPYGGGRSHGGAATGTAATTLALSSLFLVTRRLLSDERVRVLPRLVVVGASSTALAMLYELLSVPYVELLNVTLISTDGIPPHPNQVVGDSLATRGQEQQLWQADAVDLLEREHMRLRLGDGFSSAASLSIGANVVRVVHGTLVDIDTNLKFVQLENNMFEPYDHLVLAPGRQYIIPPAIRALQQQEGRTARRGIVALSGVAAEDQLRHALSELSQSGGASIANIVVYGSGLDAVAALSTMISTGFPAQRLVLCRPQPHATDDGGSGGGDFADPQAAEAVLALLRVLGVTVLDGYGVSRLEFDDDALSSVLLAPLSYERKAGDAIELPCSMIVCLEDKDIDHNVLTALTKRSIVFDGRVIVGSAYETSQPGVLAAGPVAMFTRRYGATGAFEAYSARDVGGDVAHVLLGLLGLEEFQRPAAGGDAAAEGSRSVAGAAGAQAGQPHGSLPTYASPVCRRVRLPCGHHYVSVVRGEAKFKPADCLRLDYSSTNMLAVTVDDVQPGVTTPRSSGSRDGAAVREMLIVFVHRRHRTIEGVVYVGNGVPTVHNYRAMVGLPESIFHLEFRYNEARSSKGVGTAIDLPAATSGAARANAQEQLTVPPRGNALDLVAYLRLPLFHPLLSDRFVAFFAQLRREAALAEEVVAARERALGEDAASGAMTAEEAAAQVAALTDTKNAFRHKVQLALLQYLHEGKDRRAQTLYLPSIEKQMAASKCSG